MASNRDPKQLFHASLEGNTRRAIDLREGELKMKRMIPRDVVRAWLIASLLMLASTAAAGVTPPIGASAAPLDLSGAASEILGAAHSHRLLLIGELHGTRESPAVLLQLATDYAADGPVLVGLEIQASEQTAIRRYLDSDGGAEQRMRLRSGSFWQDVPAHNDGRRNSEVLDLIEGIRRLRRAGRDVAVLAIDVGILGSSDSQARDLVMARRVRTAFEHLPRGRMLVLVGNVHAMREKPDYAPAEMQEPMGSYLIDLSPFAVNLTARSGQFWACMDAGCGPREMNDLGLRSGPSGGHPYDYELVLPRYSLAHLVGTGAK